LLLAASGLCAWSAFAYGEGGYLSYSIMLIPIAIGVFLRHIWAQYFVYFFALMWTVSWCVGTPSYVWEHWPDVNAISLMISLLPIGFMLIVSWNVYRGFIARVSEVVLDRRSGRGGALTTP
jgi:hypothetical protein